MSQENVEIMREIFTLVNDRGVVAATAAFSDLLDPAFELEEASNLPDQERHSGRETTLTQLWTLRDGKAVSLRDFATKSAALEAAGLGEARE